MAGAVAVAEAAAVVVGVVVNQSSERMSGEHANLELERQWEAAHRSSPRSVQLHCIKVPIKTHEPSQ